MNEKLLLDDLSEIIAIDSVYSTPTPDAPYGEGCKKALEWFVDKARSYGLTAVNVDNRVAYAEIGEGKTCIGALAHIDVVPVGNGWSSDPFTMTVKDGKVYGRGVGDDKGSVVVCLHALKDLKESGVKLNRRVRLIVGADEERGSSCIQHYVATGNEIPETSFVPDSEFPVINSEKGIAHIRLDFDDDALTSDIIAISGAACANAVPDRAEIKIAKNGALCKTLHIFADNDNVEIGDIFEKSQLADAMREYGLNPADFEAVDENGIIVIAANGTAEHASTPQKGDNALWKMFKFLGLLNSVILSDCVPNIVENLCRTDAAQCIGVYVNDPKSGDVTMCMSQAKIKDDALSLIFDYRLPLNVTPESICSALEKYTGGRAEIMNYHENLYIDENTPLIQTLLKVYRELTGDMTPPLQMGGGTYARELPNAVAFGCTPLGMNINMHRADENFPISQLVKNYEIYIETMKRLANAD